MQECVEGVRVAHGFAREILETRIVCASVHALRAHGRALLAGFGRGGGAAVETGCGV